MLYLSFYSSSLHLRGKQQQLLICNLRYSQNESDVSYLAARGTFRCSPNFQDSFAGINANFMAILLVFFEMPFSLHNFERY